MKDLFASEAAEGRGGRAQEKRTDEADAFERLAEDAFFEGFDVNDDVGEFGHRHVRLQEPWYNA